MAESHLHRHHFGNLNPSLPSRVKIATRRNTKSQLDFAPRRAASLKVLMERRPGRIRKTERRSPIKCYHIMVLVFFFYFFHLILFSQNAETDVPDHKSHKSKPFSHHDLHNTGVAATRQDSFADGMCSWKYENFQLSRNNNFDNGVQMTGMS